MFYRCNDFFAGIDFITSSASDAKLFLVNHSHGWVFKYYDDGQVIPIFLAEDIEVSSYD